MVRVGHGKDMRPKNTNIRIKRKKTAAYAESEPEDVIENTTGYCMSCMDSTGTEIILVPYHAEYGYDRRYLVCPQCHKIIPKGFVPHRSETEVLGRIGDIGSSAFEVVQRKRRVQRSSSDVFQVEDYPLAGKIDNDLKFFANQGIILSIEDDNVVGDEEE